MASETFMRRHYGASGYVDPIAAYGSVRVDFEAYWMMQPDHLRSNIRDRVIALQAFLAARGFDLGGTRRQGPTDGK